MHSLFGNNIRFTLAEIISCKRMLSSFAPYRFSHFEFCTAFKPFSQRQENRLQVYYRSLRAVIQSLKHTPGKESKHFRLAGKN